MSEFTLTYKPNEGWHSFYSFIPESILGMNQDLYTFKNGQLYVHNSPDINHNTFYGTFTPSKIKSVFNSDGLTSKLYKAFKITGTDSWDVLMMTDLQDTGHINSEWFEKKENSYFAFARNSGSNPAENKEYELRRFNGIGLSTSVTNVGSDYTINFGVDVGTRISIGDFVYRAAGPSYDTPILSGKVIATTGSSVTIDTSISGATAPTNQDDFILYTKETLSESNGVVGQYCIFEMTNDNTNNVELFAVEAELMKSFR